MSSDDLHITNPDAYLIRDHECVCDLDAIAAHKLGLPAPITLEYDVGFVDRLGISGRCAEPLDRVVLHERNMHYHRTALNEGPNLI